MNDGRVEQVGTPEDVYLRPRTRFVAGFLGAVNWIDGVGVRPEAVRICRARGDRRRLRRRAPASSPASVFSAIASRCWCASTAAKTRSRRCRAHAAPLSAGDAVHILVEAADEMSFP